MMASSAPRPLRVAVVQTSPAWGEIERNRAQVDTIANGSEPFDVAVLPELALTGYQFRSRAELASLAEPAPGPTTEWMTALAARHGAVIVGGLAEREGDRIYNAAAVVTPRGHAGTYRKVHLFDRETEVFDPGDRGFLTWDVETASGPCRLGVMICFDWRFPEAARTLTFMGAELIAHPSNLVLPHCPDAMVTRCLENVVHAATANRVGTEDRWQDAGAKPLQFTGRSQVVDAAGRRVAALPSTGTGVATATVDLAATVTKRTTARNDLWSDLRPDAYLTRPERRP
jgi:predicted amidohydrolase